MYESLVLEYFDLAEYERDKVCEDHNRASDDQSHGGAEVELFWPEGQVEFPRDVCVVIYHDRVGRCPEDDDAAKKGEASETNTDTIEETDHALLSLVYDIPRIDLVIGSRRRALVFVRHYEWMYREMGRDRPSGKLERELDKMSTAKENKDCVESIYGERKEAGLPKTRAV